MHTIKIISATVNCEYTIAATKKGAKIILVTEILLARFMEPSYSIDLIRFMGQYRKNAFPTRFCCGTKPQYLESRELALLSPST